jgi:hypothetical protein
LMGESGDVESWAGVSKHALEPLEDKRGS